MKVIRFGFPVVPDFGGTAHAYCGTTMDAALGDLLSWELKPRLEDMLKAYINPAIRLKNCTGLPRSNLTPGVPFGIVLLHGGRFLMVLTSGQTFF